MFGYHLLVARRGFARNPLQALLVALAIGVGVGATATTWSLMDQMEADPIPERSSNLFYLHLDPSPPGFAKETGADTTAAATWTDAMNLLRSKELSSMAAMAGLSMRIRAPGDLPPTRSSGRMTTSGLFRLFGIPFAAGSGWTEEDDASESRVIVLEARLANRLFGHSDAVGAFVWLGNHRLRVVGVTENWAPKPNFYDSNGRSAWSRTDEFFVPLSTAMALGMAPSGNMVCWGDGGLDGDGCGWLQVWIEAGSADRQRVEARLRGYVESEQAKGRNLRISGSGLLTVKERMAVMGVLPDDVKLQAWLATGLLALCILNSSGVLFGRFLSRTSDISIRRALGARRSQVLGHLLVEALLIGAVSSLFALVACWFGTRLLGQRPTAYAALATLDVSASAIAITLSIVACIAAAFLPSWHASAAEPAIGIKASQ